MACYETSYYEKKYPDEYATWQRIQRYCDKRQSFMDKDVRVCEEWQDDFMNFYLHMGPRPEGAHISRYDYTEDYKPGNCRWTTRRDLAIEYGGNQAVTTVLGTMPLVDLAELVGRDPVQVTCKYMNGTPLVDLIQPTKKRLRQIEKAADARAEEIRQSQIVEELLQ